MPVHRAAQDGPQRPLLVRSGGPTAERAGQLRLFGQRPIETPSPMIGR
ncbi:hypothetical protein [Amycolatopsis mediterranei]